MKNKFILTLALIAAGAWFAFRLYAADASEPPRYEYVTIRWAGKENTHIVRPGGKVEFVGSELRKAQKPDRADDRAFYMNLVMNGLAKDGFEFAGMSSDEIVMKRAAK